MRHPPSNMHMDSCARPVSRSRRTLVLLHMLIIGLPEACGFAQPSNNVVTKPTLSMQNDVLTNADDYCFLMDELPLYSKQDQIYDAALFSVPVLLPLVSFFSYPIVQQVYHKTANLLSGPMNSVREGGALQIAELLPVTNGIVVPSVSVAFGTLTAITIQTLRQRQITIKTILNKEACALRNVHSCTRAVFSGVAYERERLQTNLLLREYVTRLIFESRLGIDLDVLERVGASDSELDGLTEVLYTAPERPRDDDDQPPRALFLQNTDFTAMNLVRDLQMLRSERLALLQTPFPAVRAATQEGSNTHYPHLMPMHPCTFISVAYELCASQVHWLILTILAGSLVLAFLFETDLQLLQFLDDLQLRYLFTVLTSAFLALASLCVDLADPFRGSFTIAPSTSQLECIREYASQAMNSLGSAIEIRCVSERPSAFESRVLGDRYIRDECTSDEAKQRSRRKDGV